MQTKKQKLATIRNWNKRCLKGIQSHLANMRKIDSGLTVKEKFKVAKAQKVINSLLEEW